MYWLVTGICFLIMFPYLFTVYRNGFYDGILKHNFELGAFKAGIFLGSLFLSAVPIVNLLLCISIIFAPSRFEEGLRKQMTRL